MYFWKFSDSVNNPNRINDTEIVKNINIILFTFL